MERLTHISEKLLFFVLPVCIVKIIKELVTIQLLSSCVRLYIELIYLSMYLSSVTFVSLFSKFDNSMIFKRLLRR